MNMILRELKAVRKSLIVWSVGIMFLIYTGMIKYEGFADTGQSMNDMIDSLPEVLKSTLGIKGLDLTSASGYYIMFFLYFALLCGIHAAMQGAVVISKEERDKTSDFLLVKPVKRHQVLTSKIIASIISVLIINIVTWISSIYIVAEFNTGDSINQLISELMIGLLFIQLLFLIIGLALGVFAKSTKKATGLATGVLLSTYVLSIAIEMYEDIEMLKYLTPFKYFDGNTISNTGINSTYVFLSLGIIIALASLTYKKYGKKEFSV